MSWTSTARRGAVAATRRSAVRLSDPRLNGLRTLASSVLGALDDERVRRADAALADDAWLEQLGHLKAVTRIWAGSETPWIDERDARFWVDRIPGAEAIRVRDSGPLTVASAWTRILEHVAPNHGSVPEQLRDSGTLRLADVDPVDPERG